MKTWRERIVEARERGCFTTEDVGLAMDSRRCAVGEATAFMGANGWSWFHRLNDGRAVVHIGYYRGEQPLGGLFPALVKDDNFNGAEECLEVIEDHVMQLKREQQS